MHSDLLIVKSINNGDSKINSISPNKELSGYIYMLFKKEWRWAVTVYVTLNFLNNGNFHLCKCGMILNRKSS